MVWCLSVITIGSLFLFLLFLNILFSVLLVDKVRPLSIAYTSKLLVFPCRALVAHPLVSCNIIVRLNAEAQAVKSLIKGSFFS